MPQMAPMWWSTMFLMFIITYFIIMIMMYFYNIYMLSDMKKSNMSMIKNYNWKW